MRLVVGVLALVVMLSTPAAALTCDEFLDRVETSAYAEMLPEFDLQESPNLPGLFNITNLRNISAAYTCKGDLFDGLGATLGESEQPDRMRWAALVGAVLEAIQPNDADRRGMELANRLQEEAIDAAQLEEIRTGFRAGRAAEQLGEFEIAIEVMPGAVRIDVSTLN